MVTAAAARGCRSRRRGGGGGAEGGMDFLDQHERCHQQDEPAEQLSQRGRVEEGDQSSADQGSDDCGRGDQARRASCRCFFTHRKNTPGG